MEFLVRNECELGEYLHSRGLENFDKQFDEEKDFFNRLTYKNLPYIYDLKHLAEMTNASAEQLEVFILNKERAYSSFEIPKKVKGYRRIDAPSKPLKNVQRWILDHILYKLNPGKYAHGFVPTRSIFTNAKKHVRKQIVMCIDIKDFFPSINLKKVRNYFKIIGYNDRISLVLAELCTFNFRLSQGAPTSPMLSNLIAYSMDQKIASFCKLRRLSYTRYADDITISGGRILPKYKNLIRKKIERAGFKINVEKTRVLCRGSCQRVTGIVVNEKPSVGRQYKRNLRAILHNLLINGPNFENRSNDPLFRERILGRISHVINIEPHLGDIFKDQFYSIDWEEYSAQNQKIIETELSIKSLKRNSFSNGIIPFSSIKSFSKIPEISTKSMFELRDQISELKEKCMSHPTKGDCKACLIKRSNDRYKTCIKYILGQYLQTTGGTHHGHEICDIGIADKISEKNGCNICFIIKPNLESGSERDGYFRQFHDSIHKSGINVVTTVTMTDIDNALRDRIYTAMNENRIKKYYCFITVVEFTRIYSDFLQKHCNE